MEILIGFWLHMEIKHMSPIKPGDISAFRKLFNFLIKYQSLSRSSQNNPLDTPEIICMILPKLPVHLQDRWKRNTLKMRRMHSREPQLFDLANFVEDEMTLVSDPLYSRDAHFSMKTMTLKIVFSFCSRHWKNKVSYFIR